MFEEIFAPLYAPIPDPVKYLERIGLAQPAEPTPDALSRLVLAHQRRVPFENLDIYDAGAEIRIDIPSLFDKIVTRRRGGYCFELNAAFMALLTALGYDCHAVAVRVVWGHDITMPLSHRATIVTVGGTRYFCDVGFGGPSPQSAVLLDTDADQPSGANVFRVVRVPGGTVVGRVADGVFEKTLMFSETPVDPVDFLALSEYQSKSDNSMFKKARLVNLVTETGSYSLSGNVMKIHSGGAAAEIPQTTEAQLRRTLADYFGIQADFPLRM